jgi:hypothetical protein
MVTDTATGRGVINLPPLLGAPQNLDFVFYVVNAAKLFAMETDVVTIVTPLLNGIFLQQHTPALGLSSDWLNGGMMISLTGRAPTGCGTSPAPNVIAGLLTANGNGALSLTYDQNCGGTPKSISGLLGMYSVAANGRQR